ncbi:YgdI/YgdR family lipoprotein [Pseudomonas sp. 21LCFQ010]|uniref:YgdI/YgdR family lipoprotein n=1 Tax=Pseudomonas sp. 21LCFQ010 TaxID=2957506 RepID=UPI002097E725|nr:YgdI/YgdR family lipoprotein [Pseudomonas sp. 21LCFQ010]MCO8160852.1 YgdI/YgdR family lipoprotein [Pseudomonas sp. 21LCFQ010]
MKHKTLPAAFLLALGLASLAGCSSPTVITLNDGREIQTVDTPKYDEDAGFYEFEQLDGKKTRVNKDQVRTVKDL